MRYEWFGLLIFFSRLQNFISRNRAAHGAVFKMSLLFFLSQILIPWTETLRLKQIHRSLVIILGISLYLFLHILAWLSCTTNISNALKITF